MKRPLLIAILIVCAFTPLAWVQDAGLQSLSRYVPAGAVLALEARDFGAVLETWQSSSEKTAWLASDNYADFSHSKLFLRLQEAQEEFTAATGFPIDFAQLESIAGAESVLALYDIGELRLLYITELPQATALETVLLRSRLNLEPRRSADVDYWVHTDVESGKEIAFAVADDRLFVATDDTLLGRALELRAGQGDRALTDESWYPTYGPRGDLRLIENLAVLVRSPHFRSYWIQGNITELSAYESAVADLFFDATDFREHRRLVRREATQPIESANAARLASLAPAQAAFHQAWSQPELDATVELLAQKLLDPSNGEYRPRYQLAPQAPMAASRVGSAGNLETRIDTPPVAVSQSILNREPLQALLSSRPLDGLLHVQTSDFDAGLARFPSLIGIDAQTPWNDQQAIAALQASIQSYWTTSSLGAAWQSRGNYYALTGIRSLFAAVRGNLLLISDSEQLLVATLAREEADATDNPAIYRAAFRHDLESPAYAAAMEHLDFLEGRNPRQTPRQLSLFSDNLGSLSRTWSRFGSVELERHDQGSYVEETVVYRTR